MNAAPDIFKAYDIRGTVPGQLDAAGATQIGRAFVAKLNPKRVIVGRDVRLTSSALRDALVTGLIKSGADVIDIGIVSTDVFYFACGENELPGLMVTASHNPPEYNGFKMVRNLPILVMSEELKDLALNDSFSDAEKIGTVTDKDFVEAFIDRMLEIVPPDRLKPLKVVVDTSNGSQGPIWERLAKQLPIKLIPQFFEPDGNFPNHGNDVIQESNQEPLRKRVLKEKADLGLIFDPDGDRCLVVDDQGKTVPGDFLTALMAVTMLKRDPGSTIVYDIRASDAVPDFIKAAGGTPFGWKIGHAFIKPKMQEHNAAFGGEVSGHWYFKDFWFADCGLLGGLTILEYVSELSRPLSTKLLELEKKYHLSGEINSKVPDREAVMQRVKEKYSDGEISELDGVAVRYPDWHFVVRPAANEPLIRLTLEADSAEKMRAKRDEVLGLIRS